MQTKLSPVIANCRQLAIVYQLFTVVEHRAALA